VDYKSALWPFGRQVLDTVAVQRAAGTANILCLYGASVTRTRMKWNGS
jgi:hypothetical protein